MKNGTIQSRVPYEEYRAMPGISITALKEMGRSPQHYKHRLAEPKTSTALTLGSAAHVAILEPERFDRTYAVWGERTASGRMRPRNGKDWDVFAASHSDRIILTADEHAHAMAMQRAVRANEVAMRYLAAGDPEVTLSWNEAGRLRKGRIDWLTRLGSMPVITGLKTARDCRPFIFGSAAAKLGYHLQWAWYYDGLKTITSREAKVVEIVVENEPPHAVSVYVITTDIIEQGREESDRLLEQLADCERVDVWPGPTTEEQALTLPSWAYERDDNDISGLGLEA